MNWNNYWVVHDIKTLHIYKRYDVKERAILFQSLQTVKNNRLAQQIQIDNISGITEEQWKVWKQLQGTK